MKASGNKLQITIYDIARQLGFSPLTVSRAFGDHFKNLIKKYISFIFINLEIENLGTGKVIIYDEKGAFIAVQVDRMK